VEVAFDAAQEELLHVVLVRVHSGIFVLEGVGQGRHNVVHFIVGEESADFAAREQVVNLHHELFVYNLAVGQQPQASFVLERSLPLELL